MSYIRTIFEEIQGLVEVIAIWVDQLIITQKAYHKLRYPPLFLAKSKSYYWFYPKISRYMPSMVGLISPHVFWSNHVKSQFFQRVCWIMGL